MEDNSILIVDYKSGSVDQMPKNPGVIAGMELSCETIFENVRSFQIPLYIYYLSQHYPNERINAALYNLRTLKVQKFLQEDAPEDRALIYQPYLKALNFVLEEIFNPEIDFISV